MPDMNGLPVGTRLGPYEVLSKLGAGGMGEVYRARDSKLNRDVAIKVLPEAFALDADRLARFTREAQVLASLNHPNIAAIYGIEGNALVMELVEGRDLSEVLAGGAEAHALHITEALAIARQIADALEAAHEQGIVHRDLKPQNIKVRDDGTVKVLDFGLAKAMDPPSPGATAGKPDAAMNSPTMTARATQMGMIIGTAAYMAPEQARGRPVDRRADIWAFGVVLYEMLTGRRAFEGDDISVTLANVIKETPTFDALPPDVPASIRRLLRRCLEKDPKRRLSAIGDARLEIDEAALPSETSTAGPGNVATEPSSRTRERLWMTMTGMAVVALVATAVWLWPQPAPVPAPVQFTLEPPEGTAFSNGPGFLSVSPDGRYIAYTAGAGRADERQLFLRTVGSLDTRAVPAAFNAGHVAWSPDGESIVFVERGGLGGLRRVDLAGGPARTLSEDADFRAAWSPEDVILFTPRAAPQRLMRMPASGGPAVPATELNDVDGEVSHEYPVFLSDGRRFVFLARYQDPFKGALFLASLDSMERTRLVEVHSNVDLVPGYLVYHREGTLYAHPFDEGSGTLTGDPVPVVEDVQFAAGTGRAAFATSRTGLLAYRTGDDFSSEGTLSWLDRSGKVVGTIGQPGRYDDWALSPDGRRVVAGVQDQSGGRDLVMIDIERNITSRFTADPASERAPKWTTNGESVVFNSDRNGTLDLYIKNAGGAAPEQLLYESPEMKFAGGFSPDGKLLFSAGAIGDFRVWALPVGGDGTPQRAFPNEPGHHTDPRFSPDGKWIAYTAGRNPSHVFVEPYPATGYREQISATQGSLPTWAADGRQLVFRGPSDSYMLVDVTPDGSRLRVSAPRQLFQQRQKAGAFGYSMDARAERFLLVLPVGQEGEATAAPLTVIVNWPALVAKR